MKQVRKITNKLQFSSKGIELMANDIFNRLNENKHKIVDMDDFGNEIGIAIAKYISVNYGFELINLIQGIHHGVSLMDGTHG